MTFEGMACGAWTTCEGVACFEVVGRGRPARGCLASRSSRWMVDRWCLIGAEAFRRPSRGTLELCETRKQNSSGSGLWGVWESGAVAAVVRFACARARRISKQAGGRWGNRRSPLAGRDSPAAVVPAVPGLRHSPSGLGSLRIEGTALRPAPTGVCHGARARPDGVLAMLGASASMGVGRCWEVRAPARGSARHLDPRCAPWRGRFVGDGRERSAGGSELELARTVPIGWALACFEGVRFG